MSELDGMSDAEKQFIENELEARKAEFARALSSIWGGGRCKDCREEFDGTYLNSQSQKTPSLCVVCSEYRRRKF